jgi:DNA-binding NtrC family response regulator
MNGQANILVIDDEESMRDACRQTLSKNASRVETAADGTTGLAMLQKQSFDLVILDLKMPGLSGMEVLKTVKQQDPEIVVVVITGYATVESAVEAMKSGAYDYIPKPFTPETLRIIVQRALEKRLLALENVLMRAELKGRFGPQVIIGASAAMREIETLVQKVAPTDSTVLICGETGTGKELVARAIHNQSYRKDKPFIVIDCAGLVENLFESELFGHVKGSFTGATETKHGRFEVANSGTVFLDEIGNISLNIQAKLLRVLQEKQITRVGSAQVINVDVRIIAATNKDLQQCIKQGTFRDDLFYRLSVVPVNLAPLRERQEDIPLLAEYFLRKYSKKRARDITAISAPAMELLAEYDWPGNVRELENVIERAVVLAGAQTIEPADLLYYDLAGRTPPSDNVANSTALAEVEKQHILETLKKSEDHIGKAADALGIDRKTLRLKLKKYGVE